MIKPSVDTLNPDSLLSLSRMSACKSGCCSHLQTFVKWVNVDWKRSVLSSSRSCTASPWSVSSVWGRPSVSLLLRAAVSWSHDFFIIFFYILTLPHNYITITSFSLLMPFMTAIAVAGGVMIHVEKAISLKLLNKVINNKVLNKHRRPHVSIWDPVLQFDQFGIVLFFQNVKLKERFTVLFPDNNTFLSAGLFKSTEHQDWFKCCCKPYFIIYQNWLTEPYREGVCVCVEIRNYFREIQNYLQCLRTNQQMSSLQHKYRFKSLLLSTLHEKDKIIQLVTLATSIHNISNHFTYSQAVKHKNLVLLLSFLTGFYPAKPISF